jgi:hypothetical protein
MDVTVHCYFNLLGTFKTTIENDVKTDVASQKYWTYDENGNPVEQLNVGEFIESSSKKTDKISNEVDGAVISSAEALQTANEIKFSVTSYTELLVNRVFEPTSWGTADSYHAAEWDFTGTPRNCYAMRTEFEHNGHVVYMNIGQSVSQVLWNNNNKVFKLGIGQWHVLSFYCKRDGSVNRTLNVSLSNLFSLTEYPSKYYVDGVENSVNRSGTLSANFVCGEEFERHEIRFKLTPYSTLFEEFSNTVSLVFASQGTSCLIAMPSLTVGKTGGVDVKAGTVDVMADDFTVHNTNGEQTMGLNAKGDFEVSGTVRARNLFRSIAIASRYYNNDQPRILVFDGNGTRNV